MQTEDVVRELTAWARKRKLTGDAVLAAEVLLERQPVSIMGARDVFLACANIARDPQENMLVLCLDSSARIVSDYAVAKGGTDFCATDVPHILRQAVVSAPHSVVLVHNHPGGDTTPSEGDLIATEKLARAFAAVGIGFLDHVVVGRSGYTSVFEWAKMQKRAVR